MAASRSSTSARPRPSFVKNWVNRSASTTIRFSTTRRHAAISGFPADDLAVAVELTTLVSQEDTYQAIA